MKANHKPIRKKTKRNNIPRNKVSILASSSFIFTLILLIASVYTSIDTKLWGFDAPPIQSEMLLRIKIDEKTPLPQGYLLEMQLVDTNIKELANNSNEEETGDNTPDNDPREVGYYQFAPIPLTYPLKELPILVIPVQNELSVQFRVASYNEKGQSLWSAWTDLTHLQDMRTQK